MTTKIITAMKMTVTATTLARTITVRMATTTTV